MSDGVSHSLGRNHQQDAGNKDLESGLESRDPGAKVHKEKMGAMNPKETESSSHRRGRGAGAKQPEKRQRRHGQRGGGLADVPRAEWGIPQRTRTGCSVRKSKMDEDVGWLHSLLVRGAGSYMVDHGSNPHSSHLKTTSYMCARDPNPHGTEKWRRTAA